MEGVRNCRKNDDEVRADDFNCKNLVSADNLAFVPFDSEGEQRDGDYKDVKIME